MAWHTLIFHGRQVLGRLRRTVLPVAMPAGPGLKLHLGCGNIDHPGFVNVDGVDRPHVHRVQSIAKLPQFADDSVEFIYTSHTLEHFSRAQVPGVLSEWRRILAANGKLCLSVPDFDQLLEMYRASGDVGVILPPLFGGQDYPFNFHYTAFTASSLTQLLLSAGFVRAYQWTHGSDHFHSLPDWSGRSLQVGDRRIPISLNMEAVK